MAYSNPNLLPVDGSTFEGGTSSWGSPTANTTLSVVSGQYLSGTYSLRFTATAAGDVQAYSGYITGITAGTEYVCRIPVRLSATGGTKTFTARILFYGDTGGNIGYTDSVITANTASAGWYTANYPAVVMTAPAGATRARLSFIATGLAAAEYVNIDDVYLGAAPTHPGNVYGYNTQSMESDVSGWKVDSGSLVRGSWNLVAGQGYYALELTTAAAGDQPIRTNSFIAVTPGKEYTAYALVRSSSIATTWYCEFRWYDANWNETGAYATTAYSIGVNTNQWVGITGTAPAGAAYCKQFIRPQATASGQVFVMEDAQFFLAETLNPSGNLLTYAEFSAEGVLPAWTVDNGTASLAQITSGATDGKFVTKLVSSTPGTVSAQLNRLVPVTPGTTYQVKAVVFRHNTDTAQKVISAVRTRIDWYDSTGALYQADNPDQFYSSESSDEWLAKINAETRTAPDGAAYARIGVEVNSTNPLVDYFFVDNLTLMSAEAEYELETSNETGCVTLTVHYVPANGPNASNVTIKRMDEDGDASSLRGYGRTWDLAPNPYSTIVVEDYEAPLGSRVWYSVQWTSNTGATKDARILTQTVDAPVLADADYVWFKSPGVPALNTTVMMEAPLKWSRQARSQRYDVVGRKNPVHVTGTRAGRTSSITVLTWDPEANALFDSLLDAGTAALVQAMPGYGIEGNLYVSVGDVDVEPLSPDAREDGWRWTLAITEVDRPDGGLQGSAASTWQDILNNTAYPTWEELFQSHDTWTDVLTKG